jgi:DNA-binding transcriptional regulator YiaG
MPNIAAILKSEISRVARKEVRAETLILKKAVAVHRAEIAALKRRTQALEQQLRGLSKKSVKPSLSEEHEPPSSTRRFSAKSLAAQRRRLGLSAQDCGLLLGASPQSIYNWEDKKTRPLARHLASIAALKDLSKRDAAAILETRRAAA